jgi:hypothetical protein
MADQVMEGTNTVVTAHGREDMVKKDMIAAVISETQTHSVAVMAIKEIAIGVRTVIMHPVVTASMITKEI